MIQPPTPLSLRALPREDMHVHSTFSDGASTVRENLERARARGLRRIACVDHVRRDTPWVPRFVEAVRAEERALGEASLEVRIGLEAKLLDEHGTLDLPAVVAGADLVYLADHQFPLADGFIGPSRVRAGLADGSLTQARALEALMGATRRALERYENLVIAHLFSILPKVGLHEGLLDGAAVRDLARTARQRGALLEVSEKWACPSPAVLRAFLSEGVVVVLSTDSHEASAIGSYDRYAVDALRRAGALDVAA